MTQVYGYTTIAALDQSPEGVNGASPALPSFLAGSACFVNASFFDDTGVAMAPESLSYAINDRDTGTSILGWTTIEDPAAVESIEVTAAQNAMISNSKQHEVHVLTVQLTDPSGNGPFLAECEFELAVAVAES